jgi:cytochrome c-type biogenesis protein CcmE
MKKRHKRLALIIVAVAGLTVSVLFVMNAFRNNLVFFFSPSDVAAGKAPTNRPFRLGGVVVKGSVKHGKGLDIRFVVTDFKHSIPVHYDGILPDLFREGQGVVAQGSFGAGHVFMAKQVLAKHDEKYMPPNVADALKRAGYTRTGQPRS